MAEQLFQIGIKAVVRDEEGKILLLRHEGTDHYETFWDFPGGRMQPGETFEQTLERELLEEIGFSYTGKPVLVSGVIANHTIAVGDTRVPLVLLAFQVTLPADAAIQLGEGEEEYRLVQPAEAVELLADKYPQEFRDTLTKL